MPVILIQHQEYKAQLCSRFKDSLLMVKFLLIHYSLTLRTVNTTTPNPSLVRRGVRTIGTARIRPLPAKEELGVVVRTPLLAKEGLGVVVRTPLLTKKGLGVVVRKVSYSLFNIK